MLAGFKTYYLSGKGQGGREIDPSILTLVTVHGVVVTAWVFLFFSQALLVASRNQRIHMRLGWSAIPIGAVLVISGVMVAIQSVRLSPDFVFWGMPYWQFMLVMFAEMTAFTVFWSLGVLLRKRRAIHRPMMLLATLSIIAGATVRMPVLIPLFGDSGWWGTHGPSMVLGAAFVVIHTVLAKSVDRWLAAGVAFMVIAYIAAGELASSECWSRIANEILGL
jgi:hypothetical protein